MNKILLFFKNNLFKSLLIILLAVIAYGIFTVVPRINKIFVSSSSTEQGSPNTISNEIPKQNAVVPTTQSAEKPVIQTTHSSNPAPASVKEIFSKPDPQIQIEKCKSEYNTDKSSKMAELDTQLNNTKTLAETIAVKSYKDCTDKGMSNIPSGTSSEAFASYVATVKSLCQSAFDDAQRRSITMFDILKISEYNKLEQQLQQDYQNCLNK